MREEAGEETGEELERMRKLERMRRLERMSSLDAGEKPLRTRVRRRLIG